MLASKRSKFSLPKRVTYLNCAYMAPLLHSVEKAGIRGVRRKREPFSVTPDDFFLESELLRKEFAGLIQVKDPSRVVIIPSVSYGMATVAANLNVSPGQNIIVASEQFPSNYYAWKSLCDRSGAKVNVVSPPENVANRGEEWNNRILEAITSSTRAVAIGHVHWADGTRFDLAQIRKRTRDVGALLIVDGTQSVGALPFEVPAFQPDALVCAGYKWLLGPYSIGLAYYGEYFDNGTPIEENWINRLNSEQFSQLVNYQDTYQPGSLRYEVGEHSNFILVPMMLTALRQINRWGVGGIQEYCKGISSAAVTRLRERGFRVEDEAWRGHHLFGVRVPPSADIEKIRQNLQRKKIYVSFRGDAIRVAPNVYNNEEDLNRFVHVVTENL
jgi:selenocysteine lyase/cysteine desulfurase